MRYFKLLLCTSFFALSFCKETPKTVTIDEDKIQIDLKKEIATLEADKEVMLAKNEVINSKVTDKLSNQKFNDLLRKQKYANNRFIESIDQYTNFLKIKSYDRQKFYLDKHGSQSEEDMLKQFEEYSINKKVNPPSYPWRTQKVVLPGEKNKAKAEGASHGEKGAEKENSGGHGSGHGEPAEAKPAAHGGGHH
jgi:hypothetical protein